MLGFRRKWSVRLLVWSFPFLSQGLAGMVLAGWEGIAVFTKSQAARSTTPSNLHRKSEAQDVMLGKIPLGVTNLTCLIDSRFQFVPYTLAAPVHQT